MTTLRWPRLSAVMGLRPKSQGFEGMAATLQCSHLGSKVGESSDSPTLPTLRHYRSGYPSASLYSAELASVSPAPTPHTKTRHCNKLHPDRKALRTTQRPAIHEKLPPPGSGNGNTSRGAGYFRVVLSGGVAAVYTLAAFWRGYGVVPSEYYATVARFCCVRTRMGWMVLGPMMLMPSARTKGRPAAASAAVITRVPE